MPEAINHSETQLFADDTILFRKINNTKDSDLLQQYLSALEKWVNEWQMSLIQPSAQLSEFHQVRPSQFSPFTTNYMVTH